MSKPAAHHESTGPTICVWPERLLYVGRLDDVSLHRHAATACVIALEGEVRMRRSSSPVWTTSRSTTILAGVMHALDMRSSRVAVIYNDPHRPYYQCLAARRQGGPAALGPAAESNLIAVLRDLHSASDAETTSKIEHFEREAALAFGRIADPPKLDSRIRSAIDLVTADLTQNRPLDELAEAIGLSSSRLQHLFTEQVGVPLRRFRMWIRFRSALERFANGASFTTAAIEAGFADSATFSHAFRATFGVSASSVLKAGRMPRVVTCIPSAELGYKRALS